MEIIGIAAEKGAGKGLFAELAQKLRPAVKIVSIRFSDIPREILALLGKEITRENMQLLSTALREAFREEGVFNAALQKRIGNLDADLVILDGVRKPAEAEFVQKLGGKIVYLSADQRIRFERRRKFSENLDEEGMGWEQFLEQDRAATEISIRSIGETLADYHIENNGTKEEFAQKIQKFLA